MVSNYEENWWRWPWGWEERCTVCSHELGWGGPGPPLSPPLWVCFCPRCPVRVSPTRQPQQEFAHGHGNTRQVFLWGCDQRGVYLFIFFCHSLYSVLLCISCSCTVQQLDNRILYIAAFPRFPAHLAQSWLLQYHRPRPPGYASTRASSQWQWSLLCWPRQHSWV